jgi:serine/threonine protein kinase
MQNSIYWPSMADYQEALQSPALAFTTSELQKGLPVENKLGLPRPICGSFASVYELVNGRRRWAVKCFLRNTPDLHARYVRISDHLKKCRHRGYFVTFEYQDKAIRVRGELFPLVKMEWVEGCQLNTFIEQNVSSSRVLVKLRKNWDTLVADLKSAHIAHGDLQHGNVLVRSNGDIRLIDYDGMWVPALEGAHSNETGHQDYQDPRRTARDFHADIDEFSATVIQIAISAVSREPSLWEKYNNGDNLLFRRRDFHDPQKSTLIADLRAIGDDEISKKLDFIINICNSAKQVTSTSAKQGSEQAAPEAKTASQKRKKRKKRKKQSVVKLRTSSAEVPEKADAPASVPASWISDHVEDYVPVPVSSPRRSGGLLAKFAEWLFRPAQQRSRT